MAVGVGAGSNRCRWVVRAPGVAMGVLGLVGTVAFAAQVAVDGQVRVRAEGDRRSFDGDAAFGQYTDLRTRLGVKAEIEGDTHAYVQIQDSRRFGGRSPSGDPTSGGLAHGANVDLHQAYLQIDGFLSEAWGIQAGRFEVDLGNQRVFGAVGWHNVGRAWEGFRTSYAFESAKLDGYWLKRIERLDPEENRDFDIIGLNVTLPKAGTEAFAFFENDATVSSGPGSPGSLERIDLGLYSLRKYGRLDAELNVVFQAGTQEIGPAPLAAGEPAVGGGPATTDLDISAFLFALEIGAKAGERSRIAVGVDYASGDDDPADDTIRTYDNLYYTGHKFRGVMDYFVASGASGLVDLMLRSATVPTEGWTLKGDLHYFQTAADYTNFEGEKSTDVGVELDFVASTTRVTGASVEIGASFFLPSESFAGERDPDPGLWLYTMLTVGF